MYRIRIHFKSLENENPNYLLFIDANLFQNIDTQSPCLLNGAEQEWIPKPNEPNESNRIIVAPSTFNPFRNNNKFGFVSDLE